LSTVCSVATLLVVYEGLDENGIGNGIFMGYETGKLAVGREKCSDRTLSLLRNVVARDNRQDKFSLVRTYSEIVGRCTED